VAGPLSARATAFTSTAVGDLVSWNVDTNGHAFPAKGGAADEQYPHVVVDRSGVEWTVREVATPQPWARGERCLVLNSRECVRRIWRYPAEWRGLDAAALLRLGTVD
jgi:hypothetical protein